MAQHPQPGGRHPDDDEHGHAHTGANGHSSPSSREGHSHEDDGHDHPDGPLALLSNLGLLHGHSHATSTDRELEASEKGIRTVKLSLVLLAMTAAFQVVIVVISGSVALFADTVHNFTDALTALPLWLAFILGRRPASRRYTYGYGRAEDIAGVIIVLVILFSALVAGYESFHRLRNPTGLDNIEWVIVAAIAGFIGNEAVAIMRIRTGKEIHSAALVADGQHARVDGLTSLAVLAGAIGVLAGAPVADPIVGALITVAILFITKDAAISIWRRLLDATDPELLETMEAATREVVEREPAAHGFEGARLRWLGHRLQAELFVSVDPDIPTRESHRIAEEVRHALYHALPSLGSALVHIDPWANGGEDDGHLLTDHHRPSNGA